MTHPYINSNIFYSKIVLWRSERQIFLKWIIGEVIGEIVILNIGIGMGQEFHYPELFYHNI